MIKKNKKIILFGASKAGERLAQILNSNNIDYEFWLDNNEIKWETNFYGKKIKNPIMLLNLNMSEYIIVITSMYLQEIKSQLVSYNLQEENIMSMRELIILIFNNTKHKYTFDEEVISFDNAHLKNIIFSLPNGFVIGGVETWTFTLFDYIQKYNNINSKIVSIPKQTNEPQKYKNNIISWNIHYDNYFDSIYNLSQILNKYNEVIIIVSKSEELLLACALLKEKINKKIKVISIMHSDNADTYNQNLVFSSIIDKYICVSRDIEQKFKKMLNLRTSDIVFKMSPVSINENLNKKSFINSDIIKIGYIGRLIIKEKRVDKLLELIGFLEKNVKSYELHIAGDGEFYGIISDFIKHKNLNNKIFLYGFIDNNKLDDFWADKDIFVNVSDTEGTSIAMLEAIGRGIIPVVTNTSGVNSIVVHNHNGFIVEKDDMEQMSLYIKYLKENIEIIRKFSTNSKKIVNEKCSIEDYVKYLC
ncbi:glycosyltransferase family 4 protein [Clostridium sp. FP2]|uniref:glycosyltransferase family 4 protein n=1 Tax=Clostridium sp. FP2 TaxID=2724481 RepID=UPI0013E8F8F4|nr:glycosyltransferase family 4 protein [Clostridium sp. FP2]MBZ9624560.1 glycosyltransferase family 4 protein [Clostridium sp. FP2]